MSRHFGKLPPLSTLEGFESAARLKSFSLAAQELNVTQSAISHQIRSLEEFFHLALFNRVGRSVELTIAGQDFLETVTDALAVISRGKRRMDFYYRPGSVVWGVHTAFAGKWLVPRYALLRESFPEVQPWLFTSDDAFDLESQEVDLAIWYGDGQWPNVQAVKLMHDYLTPLASPALLKEQSLNSPEQLMQYTLLHDERTDDWLSWFNADTRSETELTEGFVFSDAGLLLDAAASAQGIALGSVILGQRYIESGQLAQPFTRYLKTKDAYYLVFRANQPIRPSVQKVINWLNGAVDDFITQFSQVCPATSLDMQEERRNQTTIGS